MSLHNFYVYKCSLCDKRFAIQINYNTHMAIHEYNKRIQEQQIRTPNNKSIIKKYPCNFEKCTKVFATTASLKNHMNLHTGKKSFICLMCKQSFATAGTLKIHFGSLKHQNNKMEYDKLHNLCELLMNEYTII